jgi:hypothetical protein
VLLWLAWIIDKPDEEMDFPKWLRALTVINGAICVLALTNDFHFLTFPLDVNNPNWDSEYGHGIGAHLLTAGWLAPLLAAVVMLLRKSGGNVRKMGLVFPFAFFALQLAYGYGYVNRIPIAWESDITMVTGIFTLLFTESIIRSGMIPVNTKYTTLFTNSPLGMQIVDSGGGIALSSASAFKKYDNDMFTRALASYPLPAQQDESTLLFTTRIIGGYALWQEDIGGLNRLHKEMEESVRRLTVVNAVLAKEEKIKRIIDEEHAKVQLMEQLEAEIAGHTAKLSARIERLENLDEADAGKKSKETARIALLLCYVKRRCNLFFREKETESLPADELMVYIDELAEIAGYSGVKIITGSKIETQISVRRITLFYDFFYSVVDYAAELGCPHILAHLTPENGNIAMRLLASGDARSFQAEKGLGAAIASDGGTYTAKDLDDAVGISLSFPKGGEGCA